MNRASATGMWWLASEGDPTGPYPFQAVLQKLSTGTISATTLACPVHGPEWKPLAHWPEFVDVRQPSSKAPLPTNPHLPLMANWICRYCFLLSPASFLLNWFLTGLDGPEFRESSRMFGLEELLSFVSWTSSFILIGAGIIGAIQLKNHVESGGDIILASFWGGMLFGVVELVWWILLIATANPADFADTSAFLGHRELVLSLFQLAWGILEFAFLIAAMVWLHRSRASRFASRSS